MRNLMILPLMMTAACAAPGVDVRMIDRGISSAQLGVEARLAEADGLLAVGSTGLAIEGYRKALRLDPRSARANAGLARAYDRMGRFDLSRRYYETALAHAPGDPALYEAFAASKMRQGDRAGASALLAEAADRQARHAALAARAAAEVAPPPPPVALARAPAPAPAPAPTRAAPDTDASVVATGPRLERLSGHEVLLASTGSPALPAAAAPVAAPAARLATARAFAREELGDRRGALAAPVDDRPAIITLVSRDTRPGEGLEVTTPAPLAMASAINGPLPAPGASGVVPMVSAMMAAPLAASPVVAPPAPALPAAAIPVTSLAMAAAPAPTPLVAPPAPSRAPVAASALLAARPAPVAATITVIDTAMIAAVALASDVSLSGATAPIAPPPPVAPVAAPGAEVRAPAMMPAIAPPPPVAPVHAAVTLAAQAGNLAAAAGIGPHAIHDGSARRARSIILYPEGGEAAARRLAARLGLRVTVQRGPVDRVTLHLGRDAARALLPQG
ncbi:tetratricopeptide repeat protein [Sphingomicrobium astaxanthinifaciens]|uniref:tetratricopeptide repeat protein n=1 Tax=Sphingomicrobium astaxanthinifaciens TaxID=1227949 RepID=UPI001FCA6FB3|nr:tetratricopeptide repeat protein [Sphingomicrobium astaxanthinifaciens]MCJ7421290.1 tetratricopeptide repeat protein [Sphingomicrobium astaxanthinifaciens]